MPQAKRRARKSPVAALPPTPDVESASLAVPTVAFVTRQYPADANGVLPTGGPQVKNEVIKVHRFLTVPTEVQVGMGLTLNLGNYETARVDVTIRIPCYREEAEQAYAAAREWVETRLQSEVEDIRKGHSRNF